MISPVSDPADTLAAPQLKTVDGLYVTLTGLMAHSPYRIRIQAATRIGNGPLSTPVTCLTDETGFLQFFIIFLFDNIFHH